jgi:molecular chaperone DnaK
MARRCLVVANQHYTDPAFDELPGAAEDATALSEVLATPEIGDFEVTVLRDASGRIFHRAIESFFRQAERGDLLWLHLSCHGMKNRNNRLFLIASDTEHDYLDSTGVDCTFLSDQVEGSRSNQVVVFLDCCYSGAYSRGLRTRSGQDTVNVAEALGGRGRVVITASNALQFSHESTVTSRNAAEPSIFTQSIVHGLRTGEADLDYDGRISVDELYDYVHGWVRERLPSQTPTRSVSSAEGTLYVARSVRRRSSGLPPEIDQAVRSPLSWQRIGVIHELENLLSSRYAALRSAAETALAALTADPDSVVSARARAMWFARGLGDLPGVEPAAPAPKSGATYVAGIDFGTTNSSVAVFHDGECRVVPNPLGERVTPSVAALTASGEWIVGEPAKRQAAANPDRTFSSIKLKLGTGWTTELDGRRFTAEDIAAVILRQLKVGAEEYLGGTITGVVLTVPAHFDLEQRHATVHAARTAGLRVVRVMTEPTAAAVAYGVDTTKDEQTVLVFDLGGGTFDVSLLEIGFSPANPALDLDFDSFVVDVRATGGDNNLGGDDWDKRILNWLVARFSAAHGISVARDRAARRRLQEVAERAKVELSSTLTTTISVPYLTFDAHGKPLSLEERLARTELQEMTTDLLDRVAWPVRRVLLDAGLSMTDIDQVVLVGGATRMPAIGELVEKLTGVRPRRGLIPDGVAMGAAIQGAVLSGLTKDVLLLDATPMSLGVETKGGVFTKLVERNSTIPTKRAEIFSTHQDGQTTMQVVVYQGEHEVADHNKKVGVLELTVIPPAPRGVPQIEVTFDIDANGVVHVTAKDLGTGRESSLAITAERVREAAFVRTDPEHLPAALPSATEM